LPYCVQAVGIPEIGESGPIRAPDVGAANGFRPPSVRRTIAATTACLNSGQKPTLCTRKWRGSSCNDASGPKPIVCRIPLEPIAELRRRPYPATPCLHSRGISRACKTLAYAPSPKREADPESGRRGSKPSRRGPEGRHPAAVAYARLVRSAPRRSSGTQTYHQHPPRTKLRSNRTLPANKNSNQFGTGVKNVRGLIAAVPGVLPCFSHLREDSLGIPLQRHRIPSYVLLHFRLIRRNVVEILSVFQSVRLPAHTIPR